MNKVITKRGEELLAIYRLRPSLYASDRESWLCIITTILHFMDINLDMSDFYAKHLYTQDNISLTTEKLTTIWAQIVVDDAIQHVKLNKLSAFL